MHLYIKTKKKQSDSPTFTDLEVCGYKLCLNVRMNLVPEVLHLCLRCNLCQTPAIRGVWGGGGGGIGHKKMIASSITSGKMAPVSFSRVRRQQCQNRFGEFYFKYL